MSNNLLDSGARFNCGLGLLGGHGGLPFGLLSNLSPYFFCCGTRMWVVDGHRGSYFYFVVYRLGFRMASDRFIIVHLILLKCFYIVNGHHAALSP